MTLKWVQKKTLTPEFRCFIPFLRQMPLPYSDNRKRHFLKSADTALFSIHKIAPLFCIKISVQIWQSTLQMIQCNHLVVPFLCRVAVSLYDFLDSGCIFRLENTTTFLTIENNTQEFRFENLSHLNYTQTLNKPYSFRVRFT